MTSAQCAQCDMQPVTCKDLHDRLITRRETDVAEEFYENGNEFPPKEHTTSKIFPFNSVALTSDIPFVIMLAKKLLACHAYMRLKTGVHFQQVAEKLGARDFSTTGYYHCRRVELNCYTGEMARIER